MAIKIERGKQLLNELISILKQLPDQDIINLLDNNQINEFLLAIFNVPEVKKYSNIAKFLLANKNRATTIAVIRQLINQNFVIGVKKGNQVSYVSPSHHQFFDDGVMYFEGVSPYTGSIAYYDGKEAKYAIASRDVRGGEEMGPDAFDFIKLEDYQERMNKMSLKDITHLEKPLQELKSLIDKKNNDESKYQDFFMKYPWAFGLVYTEIQDLRRFDDANIPDFTGIRSYDKYRDIIEIKPPFTRLFTIKGRANSFFNGCWNQAERYLDFARQQRKYLSEEKGLNFDNPQCLLICGYNLSKEQMKIIRRKERLNPAIKILTYNDLFALIKNTLMFIRTFKDRPRKK